MTQKTLISKPTKNGISCISCQGLIAENYCPNCGEKKLNAHDFEFKHYIEETFEGYTHFDNKFFRSAWLLITKPGLLTVNFCMGKRVPYMRPFAIFFICNVLFFLLIGQSNIFSLPFDSFYEFKPFTNFHSRELVDEIAPSEEQRELLKAPFNQKMGTESKTYLLVFIPLLAFGGLIVQKKKYLTEHLVFSTHFFAFVILFYTFLTVAISTPYYRFVVKGTYSSNYDFIATLGSLIIFGLYYFFAAKRFYKASTGRALTGAVVTLITYTIGLYAYRFLLFYKIINSLGT